MLLLDAAVGHTARQGVFKAGSSAAGGGSTPKLNCTKTRNLNFSNRWERKKKKKKKRRSRHIVLSSVHLAAEIFIVGLHCQTNAHVSIHECLQEYPNS